MSEASETVREAVGVFQDERALQDAVDELMIHGFDRADLSLLADHRAVEEKLGHVVEKISDIEDDPGVPRQAYAGSDSLSEAKGAIIGGLGYLGAVASAGFIVASGGAVAAAIVGAVAAGGAGGAVGALLSRVMDRQHAQRLEEHLAHGGLLLWVRTPDTAHEQRAVEVLTSHGADDVHVHDLPHERFSLKGGVSYDLSFMKRLGL